MQPPSIRTARVQFLRSRLSAALRTPPLNLTLRYRWPNELLEMLIHADMNVERAMNANEDDVSRPSVCASLRLYRPGHLRRITPSPFLATLVPVTAPAVVRLPIASLPALL
jgi:hypothetical protein